MQDIDFLALVPSAEDLDAEHDERVRDAIAAREAQEFELEQQQRRQALIDQGCPAKDLARVLDGNCRETDAITRVAQARSDGSSLLVLSGGRGVGKTTSAAWWLLQRWPAVEYVATGPVRFVDATNLGRWPRFDDAAMRKLTRARALVIDDLGVEYADKHGAFASLLDEVVNSRYAATLDTLITTNLPAADFKSRYGERLADRIREAGEFVELKGESMRGKK